MSESLKLVNQYTVEPLTEKDIPESLQFLKRFFFKDEPLNTSLDLGECKELEEYSVKCIPEHCSFKAVNPNGQMIGILLNGIIKKNNDGEEGQKLSDKCQHAKFKKILELMDYIDTKFNIFDLYPNAEKILDAKILSVDTSYRGMGIAGRLIEETIQYTKKNSIPVLHVLCTSHFSARVLEKLDFHEVFNLPYEKYVVNDEVVLNPAKPHVAARILVKDV